MYQNLSDILVNVAEESLNGVIFITDDKGEDFLSYRELFNKSIRILGSLDLIGLKQGDEVVFQIDDAKNYICIFWACILGGYIPVPLSVGFLEENSNKLINAWKTLRCPWLITTEVIYAKLIESFWERIDFNRMIKGRLIYCSHLEQSDRKGTIKKLSPDKIAFIQFSSGSTNLPKGVVLTHENILTNSCAIIKRAELTNKDSSLNWMPLTHDMGLIGFHITPLVVGINQYQLRTATFIRNPGLWLAKASEHKISLLASPSFGMKHFLNWFERNQDKRWDLSNIRLIFNGAEPISFSLCEEFLSKLKIFGLRNNAIFPCYGLAEASLAVTLPSVDEVLQKVSLDRSSIKIGEPVKHVSENSNNISFVDVGFPVEEMGIRICDEEARNLPTEFVGHIQIKGRSVTKGYYDKDHIREEAYTNDGWLNTGDIGFLKEDNHLIVTGRSKEIIFINGSNYYPHDLELIISQQCKDIEMGRVAICSVPSVEIFSEEIIAFVQYRKAIDGFFGILEAVKSIVVEKVGICIKEVIPVHHIPKTTSGKIQRCKLKQKYIDGEFDSVILQIATLKRNSLDCEQDKVEIKLKSIWHTLTGNTVNNNENLMDAGGTSFIFAQFITEVDKTYPGLFNITDLFGNPNLLMISSIIEERMQKKNTYKHAFCNSDNLLRFPNEFFSEDDMDGDSYRIEVEFQNLPQENIVFEKMLFTLALLFSGITRLNVIPIYTVLNKQGMVEIVTIQVTENDYKITYQNPSIKLNILEQWLPNRQELVLYPIVYAKNSVKDRLALNHFDLLLGIEMFRNSIEITFDFHKRLNANKMEKFMEEFVERFTKSLLESD